MKLEQQQQAERLYFQTDLSKTQIADFLGISRRTIHYWVHENNWDQLKKTAAGMPSLIVGNCYQMMAKLSEHILSPERSNKPITREEVDSLYKLTLTINKLKARSVLNENMETFTGFLENINKKSPELADGIRPLISSYISSCAYVNAGHMRPEQFNNPAPLSNEENLREAELDKEDLMAWEAAKPGAKESQPSPATSANVAPIADKPVTQVAETPAPPKYDIRRQLRGTATKGPGKAFQQNRTGVAA